MRPVLEVADIFRRHGPAYRHAHADHLGGTERRVMAAIEACRTPALGGHVEHCADCGFVRHAYNSCRDRHCPKCQGLARADWLEALSPSVEFSPEVGARNSPLRCAVRACPG